MPSETHSGYSSYSPISTLERQYAPPVGQRICLFIHTDAVINGGVEAVLKLKKTASTNTTVEQNATNVTPDNDPFGFLQSSSTPTQTTKTTTNNKFGNKFINSIKKTTKSLERGMHSMAIKADKGRNPDVYVVGLYTTKGELICMTEPIQDNQGSLAFCIPLYLHQQHNDCILKLWIRSGSKLLKTTRAAKSYLVGSVALQRETLCVALESCGTHAFVSVPLASNLLATARLRMLVTTDLKFPILCGRGWSLTDPSVMDAYNNNFHCLPLDQSYGYYSSRGDASWLIATERCTESSLVVPLACAFTELASNACQVSLQHATSVAQQLLANRHDSLQDNNKAHVQVSIGQLVVKESTAAALSASVGMSWQRPDCIFEVELLPPQTKLSVHTTNHVEFVETCAVPFYAKICTAANALPFVVASNPSCLYYLGSLSIQVKIHKAFGSSSGQQQEQQQTPQEIWQAIVPLEAYVNANISEPLAIPLYHTLTNEPMGSLMVRLEVGTNPSQQQQPQVFASQGGLVSLVGLDTLLEDSGTAPVLDYDVIPSPSSPPLPNDQAKALRKQQLGTMGNFVTFAHLDNHIKTVRTLDCQGFQQRFQEYRKALTTTPCAKIPSHEDKTPKPFRPSSSRNDELLAGIGFNIHIQSLSLSVLEDKPGAAPDVTKGALFHNITCGAPADHARGFANALGSNNNNSTLATTVVGTIAGGLRRLEAKRMELAKALVDAQSALIAAVGQQLRTTTGQHYISARHTETATLRWTVFETTQALQSITWTCAVRRANVFSQALGIAVSSYLTSISDAAKLSGGWADLWVRNGYLVTFEGLLSAAGKELGMIEDASVGIAMLRMVHIVLVSADKNIPSTAGGGQRVPVPHSPYVRFVQMSYSGKGSYTQYRLEIGIDPLYYAQRIPGPLKNGAAVQLYPLLYQVGVDIRQWGAHAGMNVKSNFGGGGREDEMAANGEVEQTGGGGIIDDEDDDVGVPDNDVLVALNYEACRKMNAYAHMIAPVAGGGAGAPDLLGDMSSSSSGTSTPQQVHPMMKVLHGQVMSSAGKMVHGIVDEAASVAQRLGGGGVVFCKSGKDRTAMQVTYKQSQFVNRFLQQGQATQDNSGVFENATLMRIHGTRLPICEKNVGQALFAFNSLQVKFMPDMLKPPPSALAGFLKGGRVFSREGAIES